MITKQEVQHIAKLARLELTEKEIMKMQKELSRILDYFDILKELETKDVEPAFFVAPLQNVAREDKIESCQRDEKEMIMEQTPEKESGYFKIKEVFK